MRRMEAMQNGVYEITKLLAEAKENENEDN